MTVIIFLPDTHSFFIVSKVIIDKKFADTRAIAVNEKKRFIFLIVLKLIKIHKPTIHTEIRRWVSALCVVMRFFTEPFIFLISDSNKALELQTMECIVPIIADKIAR